MSTTKTLPAHRLATAMRRLEDAAEWRVDAQREFTKAVWHGRSLGMTHDQLALCAGVTRSRIGQILAGEDPVRHA